MLVIADETNPMKYLDRRSLDRQEDFDKYRDVNVVIYSQIWARMLSDWRGVASSAGQ